ncbi:hypothetical protein [Niveispirillum sp.]|uniref:hypothetical protein n=1 Tax=Niveispirillum sp. TaxID=1917217 RepID=UPI001B561C1D|nr:hypothetical protein [Niveispirillum sp.]MBP7338148.1 hypothetical protein [Niveispirillum sp.]
MLRRSLLSLALTAPLLAVLPVAAQSIVDFSGREAIVLDVASIEVESQYVAPMAPPNIDHELPLTPSDAVRLWASTRLKAGGTQGKARVIIKDASVKEIDLDRTKGIKGWFTKDQSQKYEGKFAVDIVVEGTSRGYTGSVSAAVARSTTVAEDVTLAQREKTMTDLVRDLVGDLDTELDKSIRANMFPVIIIQ